MKKIDKILHINRVNLLAEQRYLESKGLNEVNDKYKVDVSNKIFYHGTTTKIDKLDTLFRQNNPIPVGRMTGSSNYGTGIYFTPNLGFDESNPSYSDSGRIQNTYRGENAYKWAYDDNEGYIYIMKLKPNANIVNQHFSPPNDENFSFNYQNIEMDKYKVLRENGVDGVYSGVDELVIINTDAIQTFKLYYKFITKYKVGELQRGKILNPKILNKEDVESHLKGILGDSYKKYEHKHNMTFYTSNDDNIDITIAISPIRGQAVKV